MVLWCGIAWCAMLGYEFVWYSLSVLLLMLSDTVLYYIIYHTMWWCIIPCYIVLLHVDVLLNVSEYMTHTYVPAEGSTQVCRRYPSLPVLAIFIFMLVCACSYTLKTCSLFIYIFVSSPSEIRPHSRHLLSCNYVIELRGIRCAAPL